MRIPESTLATMDSYENMDYRPVAVAIIFNQADELLFVNSAKNHDDWGMPQGGIEQGEDPYAALFRELKEELGIDLTGKTSVRYLGYEDLDAESGRKDKRGWRRGKRYIFFVLRLKEPVGFTPDPSEIAGLRKAKTDEFAAVMATSRPEKRNLLLRFIARAEHDIIRGFIR